MKDEDKPLLFEGFEKAFVGMLRRYGQNNPIAIYDYNRCINILMDRDGMEEDEAVEWLEHNTLGAYMGANTPAMVFPCTMKELAEECDMELPERDERDYGDEHQDGDDEMTDDEERMVTEAIANYSINFMRYVKEVDEEVYMRARQYAMDYSSNGKVEFIDLTDDDEEDAE